jgi:enoyl-CoA hydratase/carnithine racemase
MIGIRKTKELMLTGKLLSGIEAAEFGLINKSAPADKLDETQVELSCQSVRILHTPARSTRIQHRGLLRWHRDLLNRRQEQGDIGDFTLVHQLRRTGGMPVLYGMRMVGA